MGPIFWAGHEFGGLALTLAEVLAILLFLLPLLALFLFLALPFDHLFLGHLVVFARGEHGAAAGVSRRALDAAALLGTEEIAHAADWVFDGARFEQELAHLFEEIVQMVGLKQIRKPFALEDGLHVLGGKRRDQKQRAKAFGGSTVTLPVAIWLFRRRRCLGL